MKSFEFIDYEEMPGQTYLGVATIKVFLADHKTMNIGFKIQISKDGTTFFVAAPSYKKTKNGEDFWVEWCALDSRSQSAEVIAEIREKVKEYYKAKHGSKFAPQETPLMNAEPMQHWDAPIENIEASLPF